MLNPASFQSVMTLTAAKPKPSVPNHWTVLLLNPDLLDHPVKEADAWVEHPDPQVGGCRHANYHRHEIGSAENANPMSVRRHQRRQTASDEEQAQSDNAGELQAEEQAVAEGTVVQRSP